MVRTLLLWNELLVSFPPPMAHFRDLHVNLRDFLWDVLYCVSAQFLDLTRSQSCGFALTGSLMPAQVSYYGELFLTLGKITHL